MKRRLTGEHLVRKATERVDVGAAVHVRITGGLLGRHVCRCADARSRLRERGVAPFGTRRADCFRDAEVGDHCCAARDQHVVRFDVPVHHASLVRVRQRPSHIAKHVDDFGNGQCAGLAEAVAQRETVHERHRVVRQAGRFTRGQKRDDVRLLQRSGQPDLAREAARRHARSQFGRDHLDHDGAAKRGLRRHEHARHPAACQFALHAVRAVQCRLQLVAEFHLLGRVEGWSQATKHERRPRDTTSDSFSCCLGPSSASSPSPAQRRLWRFQAKQIANVESGYAQHLASAKS